VPLLSIASEQREGQKTFYLAGTILDPHKEPVREATIRLFVDGKEHAIIAGHKEVREVQSSSHGTYQVAFMLTDEQAKKSKIEVLIAKSSYKKTTIQVAPGDFASKGDRYYLNVDINVQRSLGPAFWIATIVFILIYVLISFELIHRTVAAMIGAAVMLILTYTIGTINSEFHILSYQRAISAIDMNVILLLMGMMIIIGVLKNTGVFQWCAYMSYKLAKGNLFVLAIISWLFIAGTSAFLDNVTTMLLYTPVLLEISRAMKRSAIVLLVPGIMASNLGGTATLIGDPPNIIIGSYTGLSFLNFVQNLTIPVLVGVVALIIYTRFFYSKEFKRSVTVDKTAFISELKEKFRITDADLLSYGLIMLVIVIAFFLTHGYWHMEVCIPALFGGGMLIAYGMVTKKVDMLKLIEKDIEWTSLLFFIFLFIIVGAVEEVGLLAIIADFVHDVCHGNLKFAIFMILWVSAIASAFIDNIPFTATMLPIVAYLTRTIPGAESGVLWWALALGACLGGNGTLIGASANVVTVGILESSGYHVSFGGFMRYAFPFMVISVLICNVWLLLFY
jgi:Na+/H+ antiporter NhaD/arsenite permease-like protein